MTSIGDWLAANADLPRIDRERLLCELLGINRARILSAPQTELDTPAHARLDAGVARLRCGEPLAYVTGRRGFRDFEVTVSPAVLVPRPETEHLVEAALERLLPGQRVLELGTGSGAVAIALALEATASVTATDISSAALAVAAANGQHLGADITWLLSDWYAGVVGCFDLIVSNPPYIADHDPHLASLRHEPALALVSGKDGLDAIRCIVNGSGEHLEPRGWLLLEHGFEQGHAVRSLLHRQGFHAISTHRDLAGHERVTMGQRP